MADRYVIKDRDGRIKNLPFEGIGIWDNKMGSWAASDLHPRSSRGEKAAQRQADRMNKIDNSK